MSWGEKEQTDIEEEQVKEEKNEYEEEYARIRMQEEEERKREEKLYEEMQMREEEEKDVQMEEEEEKEEVTEDVFQREEEPEVVEEEEEDTIEEEPAVVAQVPTEVAEAEPEEEKKEEEIVYKLVDVDLWRTKMHKEEWGIRLDAQRAQKDRQWTKDMDMVGEIKVNKEPYGFLAIRERLWKNKDPLERRFVMKIFSPSGYWRCSIERLQGESFAVSHATKEPCPVYICVFKHTRNLYRIKRLAHFPRFQGEVFGFSYLDENDIFRSYMIDDKRLTFGSDWMIKDIHNNIVARIDGKFMNVGGRFKVKILDPILAEDTTFINILTLFSSTLRFHKDIKKNIKKSIKELRDSDIEVKLDDSEANLYLNPRKLSI